MATKSRTTLHEIERRTYLNGTFNGKYQGTYFYDGSTKGKDEFYDLEVKEAIVSIPYPDGFRHWQTGESIPFRNTEPTILEFPKTVNCKLERGDGTVQYAKLSIRNIKVLSYRLSNQLYDGDFIYGDIEGELSGYIIHYDTEERTILYEDEVANPVVVPSGPPEVTEEEKTVERPALPTSSKGCFSSFFDVLVALFYAIVLLLFVYMFVGLMISIFSKSSPSDRKDYTPVAQNDVPYSPPSKKYVENSVSNLNRTESSISDSSQSDNPASSLSRLPNSTTEVLPIDKENRKKSTIVPSQDSSMEIIQPEVAWEGDLSIDRSASLKEEALGTVDSFWIGVKWRNIKQDTFYLKYLIEADALLKSIAARNQLPESGVLGSVENWAGMRAKQETGHLVGTTFFNEFEGLCNAYKFTATQKRNMLSSFIQSIELLHLRSGACPVLLDSISEPVRSHDDRNAKCVDSVHLEFYTPLEVIMALGANSPSKAILCQELADHLNLPARILYDARTNHYGVAFQLDADDELGRHEVWRLNKPGRPQIMYSQQEIVLRGWEFIKKRPSLTAPISPRKE